ncbi:protein halfway isoform X2 [Macrosteles quadrilineatus]|uniref:protein halfway isoform X2 n=1 Tax=Macrosteles quadrilineatus TaxID=74068 RepID=UPI0023E1D24B|nr:protein halfway isoform X2 [Macrosteles quadrilineatus]
MLLHSVLLVWFTFFVGCKFKMLASATDEPLQAQKVDTTGKPPQAPVTALHLLNCSIDKLDATEMSRHFQQLIGISVTQSRISRISGQFPQSLTCLNLSSNQLIEIDPPVLTNVPQLGYLDLSNNNLTHVPNITFRNPKAYFFIDVSGNNGIKCNDLLLELKSQRNSSTQINFVNENNTYCSTSLNYQWFNSLIIVPFHQIETVEKIEKECPHGPDFQCVCKVTRNVEMPFHFYYMVEVDCSGQGLTELPKELPPNTYFLDISNNNITSLDYVATNPSYANILHLVADNNRIESITELEGTTFIDRFFRLSLRNNRIKMIPKYMLSNAFDRNAANRMVKLGNNNLPCDCSTAQFLKVWLLHYQKNILDYREIYCENFNNMKVVDLEQSKVCVYPRDWTDYIYYIIALEILLFVLLFVKVFYDYWVFKTTGYLPWPASKMPRLPCDWFFEL